MLAARKGLRQYGRVAVAPTVSVQGTSARRQVLNNQVFGVSSRVSTMSCGSATFVESSGLEEEGLTD